MRTTSLWTVKKCPFCADEGRRGTAIGSKTGSKVARGITAEEANPQVSEAPGVGLEPTTYGLTVRRSAKLSYPGSGTDATRPAPAFTSTMRPRDN